MKTILLDRDGVINHDAAGYVKSADEWLPIEGSLEAIARLNHAGWRAYVVSNQSGIGRGLFTVEALGEMQAKMQGLLQALGGQVEGLFFCPHRADEKCRCRKPAPGLLEDLTRRLRVDLRGAPFVGDTMKDVGAARAVGARPLLVRTGQGRETLRQKDFPGDVPVYDDLAAAADALLGEHAAARHPRNGSVIPAKAGIQ